MIRKDVGALYAVDGPKRFFEEAIISATSLRRSHPDIPIAIASSTLFYKHDIFDSFIKLAPDSPFSNKVNAVAASPFEETLFLDADTIIIRGLSDFIRPLDKSIRICNDWRIARDKGMMKSYRVSSVYNTGVFFIGQKGCQILRLWLEHIQTRVRSKIERGGGDQPSFNSIATQSLVQSQIESESPFVYNIRFDIFASLDESARSASCILHDHRFWSKEPNKCWLDPAWDLNRLEEEATEYTRKLFRGENMANNIQVCLANLESAPDVIGYYRQLKDFRCGLGENQWKLVIRELIPSLAEICKKRGEHSGLMKTLAEYYLDLGDLDNALSSIEAAMSENPNDRTFKQLRQKILLKK